MVRLPTLLLLFMSSVAMARDDGRWANADPIIAAWYQAQVVPGGPQKGVSCCNQADGARAQEDIRNGEYYVNFFAGNLPVYDMRVPPEVVINEPNKRGVPVVWWYINENGVIFIRCFAPGPKV